MMERILVVDDEAGMRIALTEVLERHGFAVTAVEHGAAALAALARDDYALVVSDMRMPVMNGAELLTALAAERPGLPIVMMTAYGTVEDAVTAMKGGARDFLTKPFSPQDLLHLVRNILRDGGTPAVAAARPAGAVEREAAAVPSADEVGADALEAAVARARTNGTNGTSATDARRRTARPIVTRSAALLRVLAVGEGVAASRAPVLIQGESGTGKELLARYIHEIGPRRAQAFVAVNCAALPRELLESELFGHERGAFTGAVARKLGKFELASGGTLLLDEISEMEPLLQAKLLRVLQEHEVDRVGGTRPVAIDTRVIATTNRPLRTLVASGAFRRDLYYRIHVVPLTVPPLRERREDVDLLVEHFATRFADGRRVVFEPATLAFLREQPWPGNVRELEHVIERALLLADDRPIRVHDVQLDEEPLATDPAHAAAAGDAGSTGALVGGDPDGAAAAAAHAGITVHEMERRLIFETLRRTNNNRTHAARRLGISVRTLRNKLHEYREAGVQAPLP